jgi:hypothetical protein
MQMPALLALQRCNIMEVTNMTNAETIFSDDGVELVLGAGGVKGFAHIGLLKALEDRGVKISKITGVSVGSIVAALYTNGYTPQQMQEIFKASLKRRLDPFTLTQCLSVADPVSFAIGGCLDLSAPFQQMVRDMKLKPNKWLKIFTCDIMRMDPVVFEGDDYALHKALAGSCSLPGVFRPVWHSGEGQLRLLVDGAWYHYNSPEFCKGSAIVATFVPAHAYPERFQLPLDAYFHFREMYCPVAPHRRYVDPDKHVVVEIDLPDTAGLNFGIDEAKSEELYRIGYDTGCRAIDAARAAGRL